MLNPIKQIYAFNKEAGLLGKPYDDFLESSFQIEEALEGFDLALCASQFAPLVDSTEPVTSKSLSRAIISAADGEHIKLAPVDRLDKACDAVVYAVGSMAKLGLNAQQITQALNIVMQANFAKLGGPVDEFGKQLKPIGWEAYAPEPALQALLDSLK